MTRLLHGFIACDPDPCKTRTPTKKVAEIRARTSSCRRFGHPLSAWRSLFDKLETKKCLQTTQGFVFVLWESALEYVSWLPGTAFKLFICGSNGPLASRETLGSFRLSSSLK